MLSAAPLSLSQRSSCALVCDPPDGPRPQSCSCFRRRGRRRRSNCRWRRPCPWRAGAAGGKGGGESKSIGADSAENLGGSHRHSAHRKTVRDWPLEVPMQFVMVAVSCVCVTVGSWRWGCSSWWASRRRTCSTWTTSGWSRGTTYPTPCASGARPGPDPTHAARCEYG